MDPKTGDNPLTENDRTEVTTQGDRIRVTRAEVEQARADVETGKLSEKEYTDILNRFYISELDQLRADIETPFVGGSGYMKTPSKMEHAIMGIVAHMTEAPTYDPIHECQTFIARRSGPF